MHVAIIHHSIDSSSSIAERDVLDQIGLIESALKENGHTSARHALDIELKVLEELATGVRPDVIFNLIESYRGRDRWMHLPAEHMDALGLVYTGSPAAALRVVNDKHAAKLCMRACGIPTADWLVFNDSESDDGSGLAVAGKVGRADESLGEISDSVFPSEFIIKSRFEHASVNLEGDAVTKYLSLVDLQQGLRSRARLLGPCLAERFIVGREFNLSMLEIEDGTVVVLPPAEIEFLNFPANQHHIVGYRAKWVEDTFEYNATPRRFLDPGEDTQLADALQTIALQCWSRFGLRGYARVDFRVDEHSQPWVLEINANPCIAPWSGFTAACAQAGFAPRDFVASILQASLNQRFESCTSALS